jgi:hypothetical protein
MVVGGVTKGQARHLFVGLSQKNIDRLTSGQPIHVKITQDFDLVLAFGETDEELHLRLAKEGAIGVSTRVGFVGESGS